MGKFFWISLMLCLALCGCGGTTSHPATLTAITVSPSTATIAPGTTSQFRATGTYSDGSTADVTASVTWTSSNTAAATVSSQGLATGVNPGTAKITATSGAISGSATLTTAAVQSITVTPVSPVGIAGSNQTIQFKATASYSGGASQDVTPFVTWSSSDTGVAGISPTGLATVGNAGPSTITASLGGVTGTTLLTVATLQSIAITPPNQNQPLDMGLTNQQFTAIATLSNGSTVDVTTQVAWSSANPAILFIDANGLAKALSPGATSVTASWLGIAQTTPVTVVGPTKVTVSPATASLIAGGTQQFTAMGFFADGSQSDLTGLVTWSTSSGAGSFNNPSGAPGLLTANATGSNITVTATVPGTSLSGTALINIRTVSTIAITPANASVRVGSSFQLAATATFTDNSIQDVTNQVNWVSSAPAIATVSNTAGTKGVVTGKAQGNATITASVGSVSSSVTVAVGQSAVTPSNELFVTNFGNGLLSVVDATTVPILKGNIDLGLQGTGPRGIAVNPNSNLAYVANHDSGTVAVVDLLKNTVVATVATGAGPWGVAVNTATGLVYVSNNQGNTVSVINPATNSVVATITVTSPKGLAVNSTSNRLYVTSFGSNTIAVIDTLTNVIIDTKPVGLGPVDVAVDPGATAVYVANSGSPTVSVMSTSGDADLFASPIPVGNNAQRIAIDPAAKRLYVTFSGSSNALDVIDTTNNSIVTIPVGLNPGGIAVKSSANRVFVANNGSNTVSVINTLTNAVIDTITGFVAPDSVATYP